MLITTGNGSFKAKKLPFQLESAVKRRVHYFISQPNSFKKQRVAVLGGGDSALDFALELKQARQIILIHRRRQFRGLASSLKQLQKKNNVQIMTPYLPLAIKQKNDHLELKLKEVGSPNQINCLVDQVLVAYGLRANNAFLQQWGMKLKNQHIVVNRKMQTSLPQIYAAGDVVTYPGRIPLIGVGFGEAQIAINSIMHDLFPQKPFTVHSTSLDKKGEEY